MKKITNILVLLLMCIVLIPGYTLEASAATPKLNKKTATIYVGKTIKLKVTNAKKVKWSSTKKSVATVNNKGKVTAKKAGKCTIKAKVGKNTYKCKITVKNPFLNTKSKELKVKNTLQLKLTGAKAKSWSSSNTAIATVSSKGVVTALSKGTATITCKDTKNKKYTCTITVTENKSKETSDKDNSKEEPDTKPDEQHQHKYSISKTVKPTCDKDGYTIYKCSCGHSKISELKSTGHQYSVSTINKTCTENGYTLYKCDICKYSYKDNEVLSDGHDLSTEVLKEADCESNRLIKIYCKNCDYSIENEEKNSALGHDYQANEFSDRTLAEPAYCSFIAQYYYSCTRCNSIDTTQKVGHGKYDSNNHNYSVDKMTPRHLATFATCTEPNKYYYHCIWCDNVDKSRTFSYGEANGHDYALSRQLSGPDTLANKATCKTLASYYYKCYNCGLIDKTKTYNAGDYADHDYGHNVTDEALESEADCINQASYYESCNICGKVDKCSIFGYGSPLGHTATNNVIIQATYSTQGLLETYCGRCLGERKTSPIPYTLNIKNVRVISGATTPFTLSLDNNIWAACVDGGYLTYKVQDAMGVEYFVKLRGSMFSDQNRVYLSVYDDKMCALAEDVFFNCTNSHWVVRHHFNDKSDFIMVHVNELGNLLRSLGYNANRIIRQPNNIFYEVT